MLKHILDLLKDSPYLLADGAMGTYFSEITGSSTDRCELANIDTPDIIKRIHEEYIAAGSQLLRTNTFAANTWFLKKDIDTVKEVVRKGFEIASLAAKSARNKGRDVYVLADIGPIPEIEGYDVLAEYKAIVDAFFECDASNFIFETFSSYETLLEVCKYIKSRNKNAYILAQFAVSPDGYTREGISGERIISSVRNSKLVDSCGFNCRSGPIHLLEYIKRTGILSIKNDNKSEFTISIMPNAGYPTIENERTIFLNNPQYFAQIMCDIRNTGVKILGGCCGTTPRHISETCIALDNSSKNIGSYSSPVLKKGQNRTSKKNSFRERLDTGKKVIAVELDPPLNANVSSIIEGAKVLKEYGADIITIADSPLARARVDSSILAAKIKREAGIETLPHITCRDRNLNAIKALLLGLHIEDIRNVLAVTGDPIPEAERSDVKGVFNLNSFMLAEFIYELNQSEFLDDEMFI
ncbi:MAG: bifunctional homocysteine S-methyltransferase/methylenetetrahydrofolate reductase, partial [Clostridiaceae bacterium]|nr:bifunctional homocysteine S-methyltransferase/methylenetetrahydrofolate reductase [Clostridiaceae bacterium]